MPGLGVGVRGIGNTMEKLDNYVVSLGPLASLPWFLKNLNHCFVMEDFFKKILSWNHKVTSTALVEHASSFNFLSSVNLII